MKNTFTSAKIKVLALVTGSLFAANEIAAQNTQQPPIPCGSSIMLQQLYQQNPGLEQQAELNLLRMQEEGKLNREDDRSVTPPTYIIPVVFHVVHDYGTENISDAQILDAMAILNLDYRKLNADTSQIVFPFSTIAADADIEFRLAQLDPNGNCTNGIDRIASMETYVGDDGSKLNQWPRDQYLNIWLVNSLKNGIAAYTYGPSVTDGVANAHLDGIVMLSNYCGSIGTASPTTARTLTHEIGHWLGLLHPWGSGAPGVACGDDGIGDTPITQGFNFCDLANSDVCTPGVPENLQNFMETSYCLKMFTIGQCNAMHGVLNSPISERNNLWTAGNLAATGCLNTQPVCLPHADFKANRRMICEGGNVMFTDLSWSSSATLWQWTLSGPTTLTSFVQNPTFANLDSTGWYDVTLIVSNATGSDTITKTNYLLVSPDQSVLTTQYSEGFENPNVFYLGYIANNLYGNASVFHQTQNAAYTGTGSAVLNTYGNSVQGDVDQLITPSYDLRYNTGLQVTFEYSYATAATAAAMNTQVFKLYSSVDCGQTWTARWTVSGSTMVTGGFFPTDFVPANQQLWQTVSVPLPASCAQANVRFKFEFTSPQDSAGNNLYIDDINILGANVGIDENPASAGFTIYPNPGDGNSTMAYTLTEQSLVKADLYDISGRLIRTIYNGEQAAGSYTMPVSDETHPLAPGTYMVQMLIGDKVSTRKFVVTTPE